MATRIGVDIGGTFVDVISYEAESGDYRVEKALATPAAPDDGVVGALALAIPHDLLRSAHYFLHGTTVALNALLERRGARTGLLVTRGFRDILEIRRGNRATYDLLWTPRPPLVPRRLRLPVTERIRGDGTIVQPLDERDIEAALSVFQNEGVECIAVAFINAYANPEHELRVEHVVRKHEFAGDISLSHRVSGEYREYERTSTTVIDAYIKPRMSTYLDRLGRRLREELGFQGSLFVTRSGGGALRFAEASARPFETILSGPAAGALGAAELAKDLGLTDVIAADVGGTSFDTCLVRHFEVPMMYEAEVDGMPVQTPWVDVHSIGAGGGSIAYVDTGGLLRVGPQSAGAEPGPAAYGRGGTNPTVTDAACVLGMLAEGQLAGGISLDFGRAHEALDALAGRLNLSVTRVAQGIVLIAISQMADAIREITVQRGEDPRLATLLPFGGAGPVFATLLARELEIRHIVIPPHPGNFSAWALLGSDLVRSAARTRIMTLSRDAIRTANQISADLFATLQADVPNRQGSNSSTKEVRLDMRYVGQEHSVTVTADSVGGAIAMGWEALRDAFLAMYANSFTHTMNSEIEIVAVRASLRSRLPMRQTSRAGGLSASLCPPDRASPPRTLEVYSFTGDRWLPFSIHNRDSLSNNAELAGPAILCEGTATTYVDVGFTARILSSGCVEMRSGTV